MKFALEVRVVTQSDYAIVLRIETQIHLLICNRAVAAGTEMGAGT
jgi:hypothetical protein